MQLQCTLVVIASVQCCMEVLSVYTGGCCQCKELELSKCQASVTAVAAGAMENGQVYHHSDDIDQLRAQLHEQVLTPLSFITSVAVWLPS